MDTTASFSADKALAEALARLVSVEEDNASLKSKLQQLATDARPTELPAKSGDGWSGGGQRDPEKLQKQIKELMHVNSQWDLEFKDLDEAFRVYRIDSKQAQGKSQAAIAKHQETNATLSEEIRKLQSVLCRRDTEMTDLRAKIRALDDELRLSRSGKAMVNQERVRELEEESHMLRQQIKAYQDDFNAERRDRERMHAERESASLRYEAEVTSLRLQLERCRNELAHYTTEANRLSQQLRLKSQIEEEQYKRHLESNGYITRSPSGHLPPLDPFVDHDKESSKLPRSRSPRLLTRGVDLVQAYSNSQGAQAYSGPQRSGSDFLDSERSRSPIKSNGTGGSYMGPSPRPVSPIYAQSATTNAGLTNGAPFRPNFPPSMTNGSTTNRSSTAPPHSNGHHNGYANGLTATNGVAPNTAGGNNPMAPSYHAMEVIEQNPVRPVIQDQGIPRTNGPLETKGRFSCPRCERKFENKRIWTDHKSRCIV